MVLVLSTALGAAAAPVSINSGSIWPDQNGNNVQGHGGNILKVGSIYYWFGEDKTSHVSGNTPFWNVSCYSSTDLAHWTWVMNVLQRGTGDLDGNHIVERPKVLYNSSTGQYVMYMHIDTPGYGTGRVGIASSPSVCSALYTYHGSITPMGLQSWDMNLFKDDDGSGYLLSHAGDNQLHIYRLSSDYLSVASSVAALQPNYEAPALFKTGGRYYLFGSELTGWATNDNKYATATSLSGPWSGWGLFAPEGSETCNSQTTYVLPVSGTQGTTYLFMGDRWNPAALGQSTYVWQPLKANGTSLSMTCSSTWTLDAATGLASNVAPGPTPTPARVNLAQGRTATADSVQSGNPVSAGNDANQTTRWCANDGNTGHWWKVDLGSVQPISGTQVYWQTASAYQYRIEVSADNASWTTMADRTLNGTAAGLMDDPFTASARYVRVTVTGLPSGIWASFFEFRVWSATVGCTPTAITPYIQVNGGTWQNAASVTVAAGSSVKFGPQPTTGGSWQWSTGATTREITVTANASASYTATYTNPGGCTSTQTFTVNLAGGATPTATRTPTATPTRTATSTGTATPTSAGGSCTGVAAWTDCCGCSYASGQKVTYGGSQYHANSTFTNTCGAGWNPAAVPSLWTRDGGC
jgi:hypothetical protein